MTQNTRLILLVAGTFFALCLAFGALVVMAFTQGQSDHSARNFVVIALLAASMFLCALILQGLLTQIQEHQETRGSPVQGEG
jgi:zinc transporter ZupT